jgi:hypothetical protein
MTHYTQLKLIVILKIFPSQAKLCQILHMAHLFSAVTLGIQILFTEFLAPLESPEKVGGIM